jgi:ATP adenylyltransferase/5',5'''-P-1,P-4-tetraphosphate phosphorylase II
MGLPLNISKILASFDRLVRDDVVQYDPDQTVILHDDGGLIVGGITTLDPVSETRQFEFRMTHALKDKPYHGESATQGPDSQQRTNIRPGSDIDTTGFEIQDLFSTHILVFNKFCAYRPHFLLLAQDGHRRQWEPLCQEDLAASWEVITTMKNEYIMLYNCGQAGGCSRLHKHMQIIPHGNARLQLWPDSAELREKVPFQWFPHYFQGINQNSQLLIDTYRRLLAQAEAALGFGGSGTPKTAIPHNVILHERWMVVIPRRSAGVKSVAANAAGMLGMVWVSSQECLDEWLFLGPQHVLRECGVPRVQTPNH